MSQQVPLEERAYAAAVVEMMSHVGECAACREAKCSRCSALGFEHPDADACIAADQAAKARGQSSTIILSGPAERDLTDPTTKLCPRGEELRTYAHEKRLATPAERLVRYWGLESPDVPEEDRWDCARAAEWLRGDLGRSRQALTQLEERKGVALEEVDEEVGVLRTAFLKGYRVVCPGLGRPPTPAELAERRAAVERIVTAISERFARRFRGLLPHPAAVEAFRRGHDLAVGSSDLVRLANGIEQVRLLKASLWSQPVSRDAAVPASVADQAEALRQLAKWAAERFEAMTREAG